jgi:hypothetical protein
MGGDAFAAPFPCGSEGPFRTVFSDFVVERGPSRFVWRGTTDFVDNCGSLLPGDLLVSL